MKSLFSKEEEERNQSGVRRADLSRGRGPRRGLWLPLPGGRGSTPAAAWCYGWGEGIISVREAAIRPSMWPLWQRLT